MPHSSSAASEGTALLGVLLREIFVAVPDDGPIDYPLVHVQIRRISVMRNLKFPIPDDAFVAIIERLERAAHETDSLRYQTVRGRVC